MTARMTMTQCLRPRRVSMLMVIPGRREETEEASPGGRGQPSPTSSWSASRTSSRRLATSPCARDSTSRSASTSPRPRSRSGFRTAGPSGRSRTLGWMSTVVSCLHLGRGPALAIHPCFPRARPSLSSTIPTPPSLSSQQPLVSARRSEATPHMCPGPRWPRCWCTRVASACPQSPSRPRVTAISLQTPPSHPRRVLTTCSELWNDVYNLCLIYKACYLTLI